jgi:hypothetical protein
MLDRIACILEVDEIDALHHAAGGDVEAGNDAFGEHGERSRRRAPEASTDPGEGARGTWLECPPSPAPP